MAVGACADMMLTPGGSLAIGSLAGVITVCGFQYVQVFNVLQNLPAFIFLLCTAISAEEFEDP